MFKRNIMRKGLAALTVALISAFSVPSLQAWDHPGHMTTAAIAYTEIERQRPELLEVIGNLFLAHPHAGPLWVAAGEARGKEATRRKFIECARWADDIKFTAVDEPTWHTARWAIVVDDAPPEVKAAAEARQGKPAGQAIEALTLNYAMLSNPESSPKERAQALCWVFHITGDIHQPMHVSDLFSKDFPTGNGGATMSYVHDPVTESPIPLHILWDSNALRVASLAEVDRHTQEFVKKHPRSTFPELQAYPAGDPAAFEKWAKESYQIAVDWAYKDVQTVPDPDMDADTEKLIRNMMAFILEGKAPVEEAPPLPAGYWEKLQPTAERRITLAGYRIADLIISAADSIEAQRKFVGR